jgi:serine protease Do
VGKNLIVTNWHVVEGQEHAAILFWRPGLHDLSVVGRRDYVPAYVLETDRMRDLAVLIVDPKKIPPHATIIRSARLSDVSIGETVYAIGHPEELLWSYTEGVVSQIRGNFAWKTDYGKHRASVIQTQTPVSFGSSGGPLFDQRGRLIGLNAAGRSAGLNWAIAINEVNNFVFNVVSRYKK